MAIEVFGVGASSKATWQVDYDSVSETIGLTVAGTATQLVVSITIISTSKTYGLDCTQYLNQGRKVLAGAGSVLGFTTPIPPAAVPPPNVKGQPMAYTLSCGSFG